MSDFETVPVGTTKRLAELESQLAAEKAKSDKLVECVKFYSSEDNIALSMDEQCFEEREDAYGHWTAFGERARVFLKEIEE